MKLIPLSVVLLSTFISSSLWANKISYSWADENVIVENCEEFNTTLESMENLAEKLKLYYHSSYSCFNDTYISKNVASWSFVLEGSKDQRLLIRGLVEESYNSTVIGNLKVNFTELDKVLAYATFQANQKVNGDTKNPILILNKSYTFNNYQEYDDFRFNVFLYFTSGDNRDFSVFLDQILDDLNYAYLKEYAQKADSISYKDSLFFISKNGIEYGQKSHKYPKLNIDRTKTS